MTARAMDFAKACGQASVPVCKAMEAVDRRYRQQIRLGDTAEVVGSVDLDTAFQQQEPNATRWDYGLGLVVQGEARACWVEPHPARSDQVTPMLNKYQWLQDKLETDTFQALKRMTRQQGTAFFWLATDRIDIPRHSPHRKKLANKGLTGPCKHINLP